LIFLTRDSGANFYEPDAIPGANQQNTLGFTFSVSITTRKGEGASFPFASALRRQYPHVTLKETKKAPGECTRQG